MFAGCRIILRKADLGPHVRRLPDHPETAVVVPSSVQGGVIPERDPEELVRLPHCDTLQQIELQFLAGLLDGFVGHSGLDGQFLIALHEVDHALDDLSALGQLTNIIRQDGRRPHVILRRGRCATADEQANEHGQQ
jgi:hypothetical protein